MTVPPTLGDAYPRATESRVDRTPWGWVLLGILFVMFAVLETTSAATRKSNGMEPYETDLKNLLQVAKLKASGHSGSVSNAFSEESLETLQDKLAKAEAKISLTRPTAGQGAVRTQMRAERGFPPLAIDLEAMKASKVKGYKEFVDLYSKPTLTQSEALKLVSKLPLDWPNKRLIRVQVLERLGDKTARADLNPAVQQFATKLAVLGGGVVFLVGAVAGLVFLALRESGTLQPLGQPYLTLSRAVGDLLAIRASQLLATVSILEIVMGIVAVSFKNYLDPKWVSMVGQLGVIPLGFYLATIPVNGRMFSMRAMGVTFENLPKHVLWGVLGLAVELPLATLASLGGARLFKFLPAPQHWASESIAGSHELKTAVPIFVMAVIVAPFWEELMFRGFLFSALRPFFKSVVPAALISSFIFASAHPQGPALWFGLATVGAASCVLAHHTKSLVPSMVMHAGHNFIILLFALSQS